MYRWLPIFVAVSVLATEALAAPVPQGEKRKLDQTFRRVRHAAIGDIVLKTWNKLPDGARTRELVGVTNTGGLDLDEDLACDCSAGSHARTLSHLGSAGEREGGKERRRSGASSAGDVVGDAVIR
jgi:hypothetical protein